MAGYSKRTLIQKLGIKAEMRVALLGVPDDVVPGLRPLPPGVILSKRLVGDRDFVLQFATREKALLTRLERIVSLLDPDGSCWIGWPKKSSPLAAKSDLSFDVVQGLGLGAGLVDVKICAISEDWSGLKFMFRKQDRAALRQARA